MKKGCVDDLATLLELKPGIILDEVQARYNKDVIYVRGSPLSHFVTFDEFILTLVTDTFFLLTFAILNLCRHTSAIFSSRLTHLSLWISTTST